MSLGEHLTGAFRVRALHAAFEDVRGLIPKSRTRDRMEIRRHALKLRYWPDHHPTTEHGTVLDLDWCWVRRCPGTDIGELRIHDRIAEYDNLRLIFFVGDRAVRAPLPLIWVLRVMYKDRDDFSTHDATIFKARRRIVLERFYSPP